MLCHLHFLLLPFILLLVMMGRSFIARALSLFASLSVAFSKVLYDEHLVLRCVPETIEQVKQLQSLDWDFWMEPRKGGFPIDIFMLNKDHQNIKTKLESMGVEKCRVLIENVQDVINKEAKLAAKTDVPFFENYHDWNEVYAYVDALAADFPNLATTSIVGQTYMGKDIKLLKISTDPTTNKPALWFDGGLHAREWITVATVTYMADSLIKNYESDANIKSMLDNFDVYICPIINVDGYDYTWTDDRMWRKTRSPNSRTCVGTDPNRNWAFHWGEAGANKVQCSDSFEGSEPASEVEVATIQDYICANNDTIKGYVNFHSYSQTWMSNWGYTEDLPPDYADQNAGSEAIVAAIKAVHGTVFEYGPIATAIYPASGSSADYTYGVCGVKYSYGAELRDTGEYGFLLPADQIIPSGEETLAGILEMGRFVRQNP